jgi:hypothetical protein
MKHVIVCALVALLALGCQKPAERVISAYAAEPNCLNRLQYTVQPEADRQAFEREYSSGTCKTGKPKMDTTGCDSAQVGDTCFIRIGSDTGCLQRTSESEFKIDWRCSTGYNEVPVKTFKAGSQGRSVAVLRLRAELSDSYYGDYSGRKYSHQALELLDRRNERLHGYAARGSTAGERLLALLSDGKKHDVMLAVGGLDRSDSDNVEVLELVQESWRTMAPAEIDRAKERAHKAFGDLAEQGRIRDRDRALREFEASLR